MHDVFISYSTRDRAQACAIRSFLTERDISCWMAPESIPPGSNYTKEIPVAIRTCQVFLLILSDNAQKSPWVLRELDGAVNNGKNILPYLLDDTPMEDEFQFLLTGCQWQLSWQENALEGLVERIKSLLPPPEPKPEPEPEVIPEPVPAAPVTPRPVVPPVTPAQPGFPCPACGSNHVEPLKNDRCSYTGKEAARFILAWLAGFAAFLPAVYVISLLLENVDFLVKNRYYFSMSTFTDFGYALIYSLSVAASVGVGLLCQRRIRRWIRWDRTKKGFRANGMRCRDCCKKFRISIPAMTRFPWEKPVAPIVPLSNIAIVRCPACGTDGVTPRKNPEGSWDRKEKWYFLPAWAAGLVSLPLFIPPMDALITSIPFFMANQYTMTSCGTLAVFLCTFACAYGVVRLVRIPLREPIRRRRVRNHIRAHSFRCPDCRIDFRLVIPMTHKVPHEVSGPAAGLRQGKDT